MKKVVLGVFFMAAFAVSSVKADHHEAGSVEGNELFFGANSALLTVDPFVITANVGYLRGMGGGLQLGLEGMLKVGDVATEYTARVWGFMNFDEKLSDAIFAGVGAGLATGEVFSVSAQVGKRFEILHGLMYRPNVQANINLTGATNVNFLFNLVNLSYLW